MGQSLCLVSWKQQLISVFLPLSVTMMQQKGSLKLSHQQGEARSYNVFEGKVHSFGFLQEVSVRSWKWGFHREE